MKKNASKREKIQRQVELFRAALDDAAASIERGEKVKVTISRGNIKMGVIPSVSRLPLLTCPSCCKDTCAGDCYAAKLTSLRPSVLKSWARNTAAAFYAPDVFWGAVDKAMKKARFFRFHVSGDIVSRRDFRHIVDAARNNPHCQVLAFTKAFRVVNSFIDTDGPLPQNMHVLFSGWQNLTPDNPHCLPETNVIMPGAEVPKNWTVCTGNCYECAVNGRGCWTAGAGETIAFHKH